PGADAISAACRPQSRRRTLRLGARHSRRRPHGRSVLRRDRRSVRYFRTHLCFCDPCLCHPSLNRPSAWGLRHLAACGRGLGSLVRGRDLVRFARCWHTTVCEPARPRSTAFVSWPVACVCLRRDTPATHGFQTRIPTMPTASQEVSLPAESSTWPAGRLGLCL